MGQALYRKYRSKSFDDVVGQEHITSTLKKALASGRVRHAYLFTGPRGVGKTSVARILAHEVSGLPYTDESIHLDIIEIDAASNRRIDEIRELRDKVHISPTSAKYKVYIIDEVHMLTREAFNALLKTLEEPPEHCIFILATTEAHKLPETITSRTQKFEFKPISAEDAAEHLAAIAKKEKIAIDKPALELLAVHGDGSFRDSISLLDQLAATGDKITAESVREFLGLPPDTLIDELLDAVSTGRINKVLESLNSLAGQGADAGLISRLIAKKLRQQMIEGRFDKETAELLKALIEVPASYRPDDALEIALLEAASRTPASTEPAKESVAARVTTPKSEVIEKPAAPAKAVEHPSSDSSAKDFDETSWAQILDVIKGQAASLYTALRLATPRQTDGKLVLTFQFPLHQKKVNSAKHRELIGAAVADVLGRALVIETEVSKAEKKPAAKPKAEGKDLQTISNIFGQAEVLES